MGNPFEKREYKSTGKAIAEAAADFEKSTNEAVEGAFLDTPVSKITAQKDDQYASIVFLQGDEAVEALEILENDGEQAVLDYLMQWDYGEYDEVRDESGRGTDDDSFTSGDYVVSYNNRLGYIGLEKAITGEGVLDQYGSKVPVDELVQLPKFSDLSEDEVNRVYSTNWYEADGVLLASFAQAPEVLGKTPFASASVLGKAKISRIDSALYRGDAENGFYHA